MYCPNCGIKLQANFCTHCGYMRNGKFIECRKNIDEGLLSYYFGNRYDYYTRNRNWFLVGILGPIYVLSNGFFINGILLYLLDSAILLGVFILNHMFLFTYVVRMMSIIFLFINRIVWATVGNMIYLRLLSKKLTKVMKKNPDNYKDIIQNYHRLDSMLLGIKYIVYGLLGVSFFLLAREIIYTYLYLL